MTNTCAAVNVETQRHPRTAAKALLESMHSESLKEAGVPLLFCSADLCEQTFPRKVIFPNVELPQGVARPPHPTLAPPLLLCLLHDLQILLALQP